MDTSLPGGSSRAPWSGDDDDPFAGTVSVFDSLDDEPSEAEDFLFPGGGGVLVEEAADDRPALSGPSPEGKAWWWSRLTFNWLNELMRRGSDHPLEMRDLWDVPDGLAVTPMVERFQGMWDERARALQRRGGGASLPVVEEEEEEDDDDLASLDDVASASLLGGKEEEKKAGSRRKRGLSYAAVYDTDMEATPSLWGLLWRLLAVRNVPIGLLIGLAYGLTVLQAVLLQMMIAFIYDPVQGLWYGVALSFAIMVLKIATNLAYAHHWNLVQRAAIETKTILTCAVFRKTLRLNTLSKGDVVTLMSVDPGKVREFLMRMHLLWAAPLVLLCSLALLWHLLGVAALFGAFVMVLIAPLNYLVCDRLTTVQETTMKHQQDRVKVLSEVLQGMLAVKFLNWERHMLDKISLLRDKELHGIRIFAYGLALIMTVISSGTTVVGVVTFTSYVLLGNQLRPEIVFPALYLLDFMTWPLLDLPYIIGTLMKARSSARRLRSFLGRPETSGRPAGSSSGADDGADAVVFHKQSFFYPPVRRCTDDDDDDDDEGDGGDGNDIGEDGGAFPSDVDAAGASSSLLDNDMSVDVIVDGDKQQQQLKQKKKKKTKKQKGRSGGKACGPFGRCCGSSSSSADGAEEEAEEEEELKPVLRDIDIRVPRGQLVAVVGAVGSGKSSLLSAILGELEECEWDRDYDCYLPVRLLRQRRRAEAMRAARATMVHSDDGEGDGDDDAPQEGGVQVRGSVAYVPQQAWIRNATLQENILLQAGSGGADAAAESEVAREQRYTRALHYAALTRDLAILPGGDQTEIGERGHNLSGGQKQRINVARAVYADCDVYLLDDPLSAVDAHVGHFLFEECICGLLRDKTRILVTHQLQFLPSVDYIYVLEDGAIKHRGTYDELIGGGVSFASLVPASSSSVPADEEAAAAALEGGGLAAAGGAPAAVTAEGRKREMLRASVEDLLRRSSGDGSRPFMAGSLDAMALKDPDCGTSLSPPLRATADTIRVLRSSDGGPDPRASLTAAMELVVTGGGGGGRSGSASIDASGGSLSSQEDLLRILQEGRGRREEGRLTEEEERYTGTVGWRVYRDYVFSIGSWWFLILFAFISVALQLLWLVSDSWLAVWASLEPESDGDDGADVVGDDVVGDVDGDGDVVGDEGHSLTYYTAWFVVVYVSLGLLTAFTTLFRNFLFFHASYMASKRLHESMLWAVLRSPMSFFHATPQGRILNRFSKDQSVIDEELPDILSDLVLCLLQVVFTILLVMYASPTFVLFMIPIAALYYAVQQYFRQTCRELQRLESISSSPIYEHFSETVDGLVTIRSYGLEGKEARRDRDKVANNNVVWFHRTLSDRWLELRIDSVGSLIVLSACLLATLSQSAWLRDSLGPVTHFLFGARPVVLALSVSYALNLTGAFQWMVRCVTRTEAQMSRVERIFHFARLDPEAPLSLQEAQERYPLYRKRLEEMGARKGGAAAVEMAADLPLYSENDEEVLLPPGSSREGEEPS